MRIPRRTVPIQPLTYMWERHKEIARLVVIGMKPKEIGEKLGMLPCRLSIVMNSPVFKTYLATLSERREEAAFDMKKELMKGAEKGVKFLLDTMDLEDGSVTKGLKTKIATEFLDRSGFGRSSTVNTNNTTVVCTESFLEKLKEERKRLLGGLAIEIEAEVLNNE